MKAIVVDKFGEPEVLQYTDKATPKPETGQVLVKIGAAGVNPVDTYIRSGVYPVLPELSYTPGIDCAGIVVSVGDDVQEFKSGDRVYCAGTLTGSYAEYCLCNIEQIYNLPEEISFFEGAAIGVPAATACRALFQRAGGLSGEKVLVHGGSGSVGSAAIQLGHAGELEMYGTASTGEGLEKMKEDGAVAVFDHSSTTYIEDIRGKVPHGFDIIIEMLANKNLETDLHLLAPGGRVIIVGSRGRIEIDPRATMGKETDIRGFSLFNGSPDELKQAHMRIGQAMQAGKFRPRVSTTYPLKDSHLAHKRVMEDGKCGKIVLLP